MVTSCFEGKCIFGFWCFYVEKMLEDIMSWKFGEDFDINSNLNDNMEISEYQRSRSVFDL